MKQTKRFVSVLIALMAIGPLYLIADPIDMKPTFPSDEAKNEAPIVDHEKDSLIIRSDDAELVYVEIANQAYFLSGNSATIDISGLQGDQELIVETENGVFTGTIQKD